MSVVELTPPIDWHMDPTGNRAWRFWLHTFQFADLPLRCYQELGLTGCLRRVVDIVLDWVVSNPLDGENTADHAWYDMSVGIRSALFAYVWQAAQREGMLDAGQRKLLLESLEQHRQWLSDRSQLQVPQQPRLIRRRRAYSRSAPAALSWRRADAGGTSRRSGSWTRCAATWTGRKAFIWSTRRDTSSTSASCWFAFAKYPGSGAPELVRLIERLERTAAWFVMPDGSILPFGDTDRMTRPKFSRGRPVPQGFAFLARGGYAIVRHGSSYFAVTCSYHTTAHKQADELSWVLYENDQVLVGEAGRYGYRSESEPGRIYARSVYGHNALILDDESPSWQGRPSYGSGLLAAGAGFGWYAVLGHNPSLGEDVHRRLFCYRPGRGADRDRPAARQRTADRRAACPRRRGSECGVDGRPGCCAARRSSRRHGQ